jgi:hypothetical protein
VIGSILTSTYASNVNVAGLSSRTASDVKASYAIAARLGPHIADRAYSAFVSAMHIALLAGAGAVLLAAAATVILLARRPHAMSARHGRAAAPSQ